MGPAWAERGAGESKFPSVRQMLRDPSYSEDGNPEMTIHSPLEWVRLAEESPVWLRVPWANLCPLFSFPRQWPWGPLTRRSAPHELAPPSSPPLSPLSFPHVIPGRPEPLSVPESSVPFTLASDPLQLLFLPPVHSFKRKDLGARPSRPATWPCQLPGGEQFLHLSMPQFPHLQNGGHGSIYLTLMGVIVGFNESGPYNRA